MTEGIISSLTEAAGGRGGQTINLRGIEFGFPRNDVTYKSTIGFMSNPTIPANETILKKMPMYELPGGYDILIMRNHLGIERQNVRKAGHFGEMVDETPRTAFTLPSFNHWLLQKQRVYKTTKQYLDGLHRAQQLALDEQIPGNTSMEEMLMDDNQKWDIHCAADILRYFNIGGVIDTENFENNVTSVNYLADGLNPAMVNGNNKKVNRIVYGRADLFNIFGSNLEVGTPLYLIFKPVKRAQAYRTDSTRDMTPSDVNFMTLSRFDNRDDMDIDDGHKPKIISDVPAEGWQVTPWADSNRKHPTLADLAYTTLLGTIKYGEAVCVAYVMKEDYLTKNDLQDTMASDIQAVHTRNILDAYYFS